MALGNLFRKYNCDKGTKHGYQEVYSKELDHLKNKPINFLEVGIFKGTSTEAFLEYFPNAKYLYEKGLYIPSGIALTNKQINYVCENLNDIFTKN